MSHFETKFNYEKCLPYLKEKIAHTEHRLLVLADKDQEDPNVIDSIEKANTDLAGYQSLETNIKSLKSLNTYHKKGACKAYESLGVRKGLFMAKMLYNMPQLACDWYAANPGFKTPMNPVHAANHVYVFKTNLMTHMTQEELDAKHAPVMALGSEEEFVQPTLPIFSLSNYPVNKYAWNVKAWLEI